nr:putative ribonuclease P [Ipomoea batatas]
MVSSLGNRIVVNDSAIDFTIVVSFAFPFHRLSACTVWRPSRIDELSNFKNKSAMVRVIIQSKEVVFHDQQLLVDWTLGKNIILTSDAPSVTEFRGPYNVVNLVSLLGLSLEHAKAALSKNCWNGLPPQGFQIRDVISSRDLEPKLLDAAPDSGLR